MNKSELIEAVGSHVGGRSAATSAVEAVLDTIQRTVAAGEKVAISGFGVFEKQHRPARVGRNPATGAAVKIKATSVPKFRPGTGFKEYVSGGSTMARTASAAKSTAKKATKTAKAAGSRVAKKTAGAAKSAASKTTKATKSAVKKTSGAAKKTASKSTAKKAPARKTAVKKTTAKKAPARKTTAKKTTAKKTTARKATKR